MSITATISEHPYITGGAIIGIGLIFILLRSGGSSDAAPQGGAVVRSGPSDSVQIANVQAATALQSQAYKAQADANTQTNALAAQQQQLQTSLQIAAYDAQAHMYDSQQAGIVAQAGIAAQQHISDNQSAAQTEQARIAATAQTTLASITSAAVTQQNKDTIAGQLGIAQSNNQTAAAISEQNNRTLQLGITTQGAVSIAQTNAALEAQRLANEASVAINGQNTGVVINGQNQAAATQMNRDNISGTVALAGIATQGAVAINGQNVAGAVQQSQIDATRSIYDKIVSGINSGVYNKGGEGGAHQVSALGAVTGQPSVGIAAEQSHSGLADIINSIGSGAGTILKSIFA